MSLFQSGEQAFPIFLLFAIQMQDCQIRTCIEIICCTIDYRGLPLRLPKQGSNLIF